jgi:hypothetical protein
MDVLGFVLLNLDELSVAFGVDHYAGVFTHSFSPNEFFQPLPVLI